MCVFVLFNETPPSHVYGGIFGIRGTLRNILQSHSVFHFSDLDFQMYERKQMSVCSATEFRLLHGVSNNQLYCLTEQTKGFSTSECVFVCACKYVSD